ncbi:hypothetical protein [Staphylococcus aureus]|uniref:hypothetical protein n=1 Tax=Staphylococcus aureus TaxID=1280 RepID=UPI0004496412|nr:hypothetical protein [Staphylococcus aureus]EWQ23311.1 hypothetical protein Q183_00472 [Staphylococcus aureus M1181]
MGPNTEADEKSAYNNVQVGDGPQQREIVFRNSTGNASWGVGPNTEADEKSAYNNVQVGDGPQQREIVFPISTDNASWGGTTK